MKFPPCSQNSETKVAKLLPWGSWGVGVGARQVDLLHGMMVYGRLRSVGYFFCVELTVRKYCRVDFSKTFRLIVF